VTRQRPTALHLGVLLLAAAGIIGCAGPSPSAVPPGELVLLTHDSFEMPETVLAEFEQRHAVDVMVLEAGDAGSMVNQAILTRDAPLADVLFGVDNTFLSRAVEAGLFEQYRSPLLEHVPAEFQLDNDGWVTPIDYGDVCLNIDSSAFDDQLPAPVRLDDLTDPAYRGLLVVQNPATSSPGMAFLLATIARFGESGTYTWRDYWSDLRANDVLVSAGWSDAYYNAFSGGAGEGDRPVVVSYGTSPAAEVFFAEPPPSEAPTRALMDDCFRQVEFAGILAGTEADELAKAFIDFMLDSSFQQAIPLNMWVFPANRGVELPQVFLDHAQVAAEPITLAADEIGRERDRWIEEWTDVVLR